MGKFRNSPIKGGKLSRTEEYLLHHRGGKITQFLPTRSQYNRMSKTDRREVQQLVRELRALNSKHFSLDRKGSVERKIVNFALNKTYATARTVMKANNAKKNIRFAMKEMQAPPTLRKPKKAQIARQENIRYAKAVDEIKKPMLTRNNQAQHDKMTGYQAVQSDGKDPEHWAIIDDRGQFVVSIWGQKNAYRLRDKLNESMKQGINEFGSAKAWAKNDGRYQTEDTVINSGEFWTRDWRGYWN